jgi:hypothetical protein
MEPAEILGVAAQVAVALAGFAGGGRSFRTRIGARMVTDRQISPSPTSSRFIYLALCMIGLLAVAIKPVLAAVWRWCSGAAFMILLQFSIGSVKVFAGWT